MLDSSCHMCPDLREVKTSKTQPLNECSAHLQTKQAHPGLGSKARCNKCPLLGGTAQHLTFSFLSSIEHFGQSLNPGILTLRPQDHTRLLMKGYYQSLGNIPILQVRKLRPRYLTKAWWQGNGRAGLEFRSPAPPCRLFCEHFSFQVFTYHSVLPFSTTAYIYMTPFMCQAHGHGVKNMVLPLRNSHSVGRKCISNQKNLMRKPFRPQGLRGALGRSG